MRINKFVAQASGLSRREADKAIESGRVTVNETVAKLGLSIDGNEAIKLDGNIIEAQPMVYLLINKPINYVCSRAKQDDRPTIYELVGTEYSDLKVAGRLDADSRGLVLMTNDGDFANQLMHPSNVKQKVYEVQLKTPLLANDKKAIESGLDLEDGKSSFSLNGSGRKWTVTMHEGRNRQIRRTFDALGYKITDLFRIEFGPYNVAELGEKVYSTTVKR